LRSAGAILLVSVPATIITSDWRGAGARRKAEALDVVTRHRRLHHLDCAAGEAERHPHQRAGARPGDEIVGGGDEKALVGKLVRETRVERIVFFDWICRLRRWSARRFRLERSCSYHSHSSAPFFHS
jgi:hypothetical protein